MKVNDDFIKTLDSLIKELTNTVESSQKNLDAKCPEDRSGELADLLCDKNLLDAAITMKYYLNNN